MVAQHTWLGAATKIQFSDYDTLYIFNYQDGGNVDQRHSIEPASVYVSREHNRISDIHIVRNWKQMNKVFQAFPSSEIEITNYSDIT